MRPFDVGTLETNHQGYGAAVARFKNLEAELGRLERDHAADKLQMKTGGAGGLRQRLEDAARKLIGGERSSTSAAELAKLAEVRDRIDSFDDQRAVLRRAIELQRDIVRELLSPAREAVREKCRPIAEEVGRRFLKQLAGLAEVLEEAESLRLAMADEDVQGHDMYIPSLHGVQVSRAGLDAYSSVASAYYEAVEVGVIPASEVPIVLRRRWERDRPFTTPEHIAAERAEKLARATATKKAEEKRLAEYAVVRRRR
jgi:hypothetical protein